MEKTKKKTMFFADGLCLVVAAIWGTGFIASQLAIDAHMSALLIMTLRFTLAAITMLLVCIPKWKNRRFQDFKAGILPGIFLFGAFYTQILGQAHTTVSHCAFLTATNVVMVPFLLWALYRKRPPVSTFLLTALTLCGIGVLSITPGSFSLTFNLGDGLSLCCALLFALHITTLGKCTENRDVLVVNLAQLTTSAVISAILFLFTDLNAISQANLTQGLPAVIFLGLFSTCLCYFLQTLAQSYTTPAQAGVLLSTEGLFGSLFSVVLGMEPLTKNMVFGGLIILTSVVLLELFASKSKR